MINKTLGAGGDYTTLSDMGAALSDLVLDDDWTIDQIEDLSLIDLAVVVSRLNLNGHRLVIQNAIPNGGEPTVGYRIDLTRTFTSPTLRWATLTGPGTLRFYGLNWNYVAGNQNTTIMNFVDLEGVSLPIADVEVEGCLFIGLLTGIAITGLQQQAVGSTFNRLKMWNTVFYGAQLNWNSDVGDNKIENVTNIADSGTGFFVKTVLGDGGYSRNCYSHANSSAVQDHNATENATATGTGSLINQVRASQFVNLNPALSDFCKLLGGAPISLVGSDVLLAGNTMGIRGNARPTGDGTVSMGADQFAVAAVASAAGMMPLFIPGL